MHARFIAFYVAVEFQLDALRSSTQSFVLHAHAMHVNTHAYCQNVQVVSSKENVTSYLRHVVVLLMITCSVSADYLCVCNYAIEQSVLPSPDGSTDPIGYLYEFDCKAKLQDISDNEFIAIAFEHRVCMEFCQRPLQINLLF